METAKALQVFEQFTNKVPYGVTINLLDGTYVQVNDSFCDICEYSSEELMQMSFRDVTHPEDIAPNVELDEKLKAGEIPYFQLAKRYITKNGLQKHVLLQVSLIRGDNQEPRFYYAQIIDVTDLGHLLGGGGMDSEYLDFALNIPLQHRHTNISYEIVRLYRQQNLRKSTHLGNVAHELKTPLNSVKGYASLMRRQYEKGNVEKAQEFHEDFKRSCNILEHIISELLDLTYIETGHLKVRKTRFDVLALTRSVVRSVDGMAQLHGIPLSFHCDIVADLMIESDKDRLWDIISNLLSNAIKYTEHGRVDITLEKLTPGLIQFRVEDTGIGIKPEDTSAIFDEFQKVHHSLNKKVDSTGLGLPITRRLVHLLGGEISLLSELGVGSVFTVIIPIVLADLGSCSEVPQ